MLFLYDLLSCIGYFLIMTIFMVVAIVTAKSKTAWIWYGIGAVLQLISLIGNQLAAVSGIDMKLYWIVYFCLLMVTAAFIVDRYSSRRSKDLTKKDKDTAIELRHKCDMCARDCDKITCEKKTGNELEEETNFCDTCVGAYDVTAKEKTGTEDEVKRSKVQFCRKCGSKLPEDAIFCNKCGTKIAEIEKGGKQDVV